ncbi:arylamine N-acetyltransferase 1 [Phaeosphaeriaceae sp. PMI808]|nr:arylamine N-acetyltransferase 1 [Phaeosphaeriaceae sp. PMI808]
MAAQRIQPTYTHHQVSKYFDRLKLKEDQRHYHVANLDDQTALNYLALLQKLHMVEIPFENLSIHYSTHHKISIDPEDSFNKIIQDNNGRGGYCMENNCIFGTFLSSLGFKLYPVGGRVNELAGWSGWGHMLNLVTIGDIKYLVDVGFGSDGPLSPIPLDRSGTAHTHIDPAEVRLQWRNIAPNTDPNQRLWVVEHRWNDTSEWKTKYCFTELEFIPVDFQALNEHVSTSPNIFFTQTIILDKKILDDEGKMAGSMLMFGNNLRWRFHGEKTKEIELKTEADRHEALEKYFGIKFSQAEQEAIRGLPSQLT